MAFAFNNNHIINIHMDVQQSIGFAKAYFTRTDHLVSQDWICASFLSQDTINPTDPMYTITLTFLRVQGVTHLWTSLVPDS